MKTLPLVLLLAAVPATAQKDWPSHGGDPGGMKYSSLSQITGDNVDQLELVWTWETGDTPIPAAEIAFRSTEIKPGKFQGTPVMVDATLFIATSYTQVAALRPETGEELWRYDPRAYEWGMLPRGCGFCHRGVAVWTDGEKVRVFINTRWRLIALDGVTGEPIGSFGHLGEVDLTEGLVWEVNKLHYTNTSPPMIYREPRDRRKRDAR